MRTILAFVAAFVVACSPEREVIQPQGPFIDPNQPPLRQVYEPEKVCQRSCRGSGYSDGSWCNCPSYETMVCFCFYEAPEAGICGESPCGGTAP